MKHSKKIFFCTIMTLLIMLQACQKDESQEVELLSTNIEEMSELNSSDAQSTQALAEERTSEEPKDCPSIKRRVLNQGNILAFQDMRHFWECSECLAEENDAYNDAYEAQYPNATAEELDELDVLNGFDHHGSYIEFENEKGFSSLRAKIEREVDAWLESSNADRMNWDDNPEVSTPVIDAAIRTLFNTNGEVLIGGRVITDAYFGEQDDPARRIWDECAFSRTHWLPKNFGNHRIVVRVGVRSNPVKSKAFGKVIHYERKNNKWKRRRGKIRVTVSGPSYNGECVLMPASQNWYKYKSYKKRRTRTARARTPWLLWREALVEDKMVEGSLLYDWPVMGLYAHGYYKSEQNYHPVPLERY